MADWSPGSFLRVDSGLTSLQTLAWASGEAGALPCEANVGLAEQSEKLKEVISQDLAAQIFGNCISPTSGAFLNKNDCYFM